MIAEPVSRIPGRKYKGFTLVEVLVSVTVLGLILVLVAQMTVLTSQSLSLSDSRMAEDREARQVLACLARDLTATVFRTDVDFGLWKSDEASVLPPEYGNRTADAVPQAGNDFFATLARLPGHFELSPPAPGNVSRLSLIAYKIDETSEIGEPMLLRKAMGLARSGTGTAEEPAFLPVRLGDRWPDLFTADPDGFQILGRQVFRFEYSYILDSPEPGTPVFSQTPWDPARLNWPQGFSDVSALMVAIAVLDSTSRKMVDDFSGLVAALPDVHGGEDIAGTWERELSDPAFAQKAGIPQKAASRIRVYQRMYMLNRHPARF